MMRSGFTFLIAVLLAATASGSAMAQYYGRDAQCRQYAAQAVAPMQQQAVASTAGSTLLGAGLGAALGAAAGGGRGAAIGAASGAAVGGIGGGAVNSDAVQQAYNSYYYQCMGPPQAPPPGYAQPGYAPAPYAPYGVR